MKDKIKVFFKDIADDNRKLFIIIGIGIAIVAIILGFIFTREHGFLGIGTTDSKKFSSEYEILNEKMTEDGKKYPEVNIPAENNFKYTNVDEILNIFDKEKDAVIYFGYPSCVYCRNAIQVLYDTAKKTELDAVYYLDVEDKVEGYDELVNVLGERFVDDKNQIKAPLVIFVVNGQIVSHNAGTLFSQEDPFVEMDKSQIEGLSGIYYYGIIDVLRSIELKKTGTNTLYKDSENSSEDDAGEKKETDANVSEDNSSDDLEKNEE